MTALLEVTDLVKHYPIDQGLFPRLLGRPAGGVQALNGVSLSIRAGETLGLIGESGCGKSTLGRAILRLHEPTSGRIRFGGTDIVGLDAPGLKAMRRRMQIVFQNPYASLNPRKSVGEILAQPLRLHGLAKGGELRARVGAMLESVGLRAEHAARYPHQFSGGQRQRIAIARALILNPEFVVCDEPVSALDVSIQAQIIDLLDRLKRELGLTYLFISHDIAVIGHVSDRVAVMYLGQIVESGPARAVLRTPHHPYTRALMSAVPRVDRGDDRAERVRLTGDLPSPLNPPPGCRFHTRCAFATEICRTTPPALLPLDDSRMVACHHFPVRPA
ncbi:MAG: peptide ABC transporter ATP-binding protein [Rhodospirillales bacterium 70-18]|nr:dipeptide ABC transporter ATP-binding protein [Rhodospirillales bacterium]OJY65730.1 MAG: peptide ABC transporter ATP-binding protein [Rhodospirillales bacterium 70-18]